MKITIVGTGYVGLVTGTCLAELGNQVLCVDVDEKKINNLKNGIIPIYEPGLEELVEKNNKMGRLNYSTKLADAIKDAEVCFIAVGTPSDDEGRADLKYVKAVAREIGQGLKNYPHYLVVVNKSTVPIGTGEMVKNIIQVEYSGEFDVVSNPEFLKEGSALDDFMNPDRVVVGDGSERARKLMTKIYEPLNCPIIYTNVVTAELIKYASNSMLATQISFINSIANICEQVGANVEQVSEGMRHDKRIGKNAFLRAGAGYGGSCFPKDVKALIHIAHDFGYHFSILEQVEDVNKLQKLSIVRKVRRILNDELEGKTIAIWGLAFKPKTDDIREAPAVEIIKELQRMNVKIKAYDPVAQKEAEKELSDVEYCLSPQETAKGADCLVIATEWDEFRQLDKQELKKLMKNLNIVDGRNIYNPSEMKELGFRYISVGREDVGL
jgi:UDPglucose 6-dehydrogenase